MQPPKFKKESRSRGCKAQAFSGSGVKFLTAICEVHSGVFSSGNTAQGAALSEIMAVSHFFDPNVIFYPIKRSHGQCGCAKYTGAFKQLAMVMVGEF